MTKGGAGVAFSKPGREELNNKNHLNFKANPAQQIVLRKLALVVVFAACAFCRRESQIKEELMVSNDVMRLEVKRLRDTLNGAADEVFSLENRRQQLAMSMKERKAEIQVSPKLSNPDEHSQCSLSHCSGVPILRPSGLIPYKR